MRLFLLIVAWSCVIGSFFDGALMLYALWHVVVTGAAELGISIDMFLKQFVSLIYWVKQVAYYVMPKGFVTWLFGLPALMYFPIRIVVSAFIAWWAFAKVEKLDQV